MKPEYVNQCRWTTRVAPYGLIISIVGFGVSLIWVLPVAWSMFVGIISAMLGLLFHVKKWQTGREAFHYAAMAAGFLPLWALFSFNPEFLQMLQYVCVVASAYYGMIVLLRPKILQWIQT